MTQSESVPNALSDILARGIAGMYANLPSEVERFFRVGFERGFRDLLPNRQGDLRKVANAYQVLKARIFKKYPRPSEHMVWKADAISDFAYIVGFCDAMFREVLPVIHARTPIQPPDFEWFHKRMAELKILLVNHQANFISAAIIRCLAEAQKRTEDGLWQRFYGECSHALK